MLARPEADAAPIAERLATFGGVVEVPADVLEPLLTDGGAGVVRIDRYVAAFATNTAELVAVLDQVVPPRPAT